VWLRCCVYACAKCMFFCKLPRPIYGRRGDIKDGVKNATCRASAVGVQTLQAEISKSRNLAKRQVDVHSPRVDVLRNGSRRGQDFVRRRPIKEMDVPGRSAFLSFGRQIKKTDVIWKHFIRIFRTSNETKWTSIGRPVASNWIHLF
jgi:hypothetical protein